MVVLADAQALAEAQAALDKKDFKQTFAYLIKALVAMKSRA